MTAPDNDDWGGASRPYPTSAEWVSDPLRGDEAMELRDENDDRDGIKIYRGDRVARISPNGQVRRVGIVVADPYKDEVRVRWSGAQQDSVCRCADLCVQNETA